MNIFEALIKVIKEMNLRFSLNGRPMTAEEVLAPAGLLPAISKRADQLASLCLGYGIGASYEDAEGSPLGIKVSFDDITPNVLRLLCIIDVLSELALSSSQGGMTPLDQLMYD